MMRVTRLMSLFVLALIVMSAAVFVRFADWNLEDGYIVFRIVRNIVLHGAWAFNLGETHNASTSVLNTVVLALVANLGVDIPLAAHLLGSVYLFVTALVVFCSLRSHLGPCGAGATSLVLLWYLSNFHTWGFGLESFQFCMLLAVAAATVHRPLLCFGICGLLILSRPDAALFLLLIAIVEWLKRRVVPLGPIGIAALVCLPWAIFSLLTFSQIFPDTLNNKMWQGRSGFWGLGQVYLQGLWQHLIDLRSGMPMLVLTGLLGTLLMVKRRSPWALIGIFTFAQQAAYVVLNVPAYLWYFTTLDFALLLGTGYLVGSALHWSMLHTLSPKRFLWAQYVGALGMLLISALYLEDSLRSPHADSGNGHYLAAAKFIQHEELPEGALAALEVGTLGYHIDRPILDLIGLTTPNPEYLSGEHTDDFFRQSPALVLLHEPPWAMEEALRNDPRFEFLYARAIPLSVPHTPLTLFVRTQEASVLADTDIESFVRERYPAFKTVDAAPGKHAAALECVVDSINGVLFAKLRARKIVPGQLTVKGWVRRRDGQPIGTDLKVLLLKSAGTLGLPATTTARPDVTAHSGGKAGSSQGYTVKGSTYDAPKGIYAIAVLVGSDLCVTGAKIRLR